VVREHEGAAQPMMWQRVGPTAASEAAVYGRVPQQPPSADETARLKAELVLAQGRIQEMDQRVREAREQGRREGESSARQALQAEHQAMLQKLATAIKETVDLRPRLRLQAESDLVRLAVAIARRILHREMNADPDAIGALVRVGLEKLRLQEVTRVCVHTDHHQALKGLLAQSSGASHIEIAVDPTQERGTVIFETSRGNLDLSLETQLREIERGLTDRFR